MNKKDNYKEKKENTKISFIFVFTIILLLAFLMMFKFWIPSYFLNEGKKQYEAHNYEKALRMLNKAVNMLPNENEPLKYKALVLSKMQPTYNVIKELYAISQLDDNEEISDFADGILVSMREKIMHSVGSNYADNVLTKEQMLVRWNPNQTITYYINAKIPVPDSYFELTNKAFQNWQTASNGLLKFQEIQNPKKAKIIINFDNSFFGSNVNDEEIAGMTLPVIKNDTLERMDINIKTIMDNAKFLTTTQFGNIIQHEIGHAIGLSGHSARREDTMHFEGDTIKNIYPRFVTIRDINTLLLIYKMVPDVTDIPIPESDYEKYYFHNVITSFPGENYIEETNRLIDDIRKDGRNIGLWVDLATNMANRRYYQRSNVMLERVLPLVHNSKNKFAIYYNLAVNNYKIKDYEQAERYLRSARNISDDIDIQMLEAFIDYKSGKEDIAKSKLIALNNKYPENMEVAIKLCDIYQKEKNTKEIKNVINKLIENNSNASKNRRVLKYRKIKNKNIKTQKIIIEN